MKILNEMKDNELNKYALLFHFDNGSDSALLFHSTHVCYIANQIFKQLLQSKPHLEIEESTVHIGALLHDIGRTTVQGINHGIKGANIIRAGKFPEKIAKIAERHIGAGIPKEEAIQLGLPPKNYIPRTLEEKIVCYADKLVDYKFIRRNNYFLINRWYTFDSVQNEITKLSKKLKLQHPALTRLRDLEKELWLLNGKPFQI
ncbi:MAG: HD domain-containing protein [Candidatus Hodarchaeales archaeon]|jgi:uncharacterized protein